MMSPSERMGRAWRTDDQPRIGGRNPDTMTAMEPVILPSAATPQTLKDILVARESCRRFSEGPLSTEHLAALLHCGYGIIGQAVMGDLEFPHRPVPSAGAAYPLHLYALCRSVEGIDQRIFYYEPDSVLRPVNARPSDNAISRLFLDQVYVGAAAAIIVIAAEWDKTMRRYLDRGYRYVMFEVGHVAQNIALCAAALHLGCLSTGGFEDLELAAMLGIPGQQIGPVYALAVGPKSESNDMGFRSPD